MFGKPQIYKIQALVTIGTIVVGNRHIYNLKYARQVVTNILLGI